LIRRSNSVQGLSAATRGNLRPSGGPYTQRSARYQRLGPRKRHDLGQAQLAEIDRLVETYLKDRKALQAIKAGPPTAFPAAKAGNPVAPLLGTELKTHALGGICTEDGTIGIIRAEGTLLIDALDACRKVLQIPLRGVDRTVLPSGGAQPLASTPWVIFRECRRVRIADLENKTGLDFGSIKPHDHFARGAIPRRLNSISAPLEPSRATCGSVTSIVRFRSRSHGRFKFDHARSREAEARVHHA
jgi:hypothetical protein